MSAARPPRPARALGPLALFAALLLAGAALSLLRIRDFDYWWHLKTGEIIAATGAVPMYDSFTFSVPGARYLDVHWLFQLALHGAFGLGGHGAVVIAVFAVVLATLFLAGAAAHRRERPALTVGFLALGLLAASDRIMPRPELATLLLLAVEIFALERFFAGRSRALWLLPPLHLLWANLHGLFALGLAVLGLALVGEGLDAWLRPGTALDRRRLGRLAGALALSAAACLVNPNGLDLVAYPLKQLLMIGTSGQREAMGLPSVELMPLLRWRQVRAPVLVGFTALAVLSGLGVALAGRRAHARHALWWAVFVGLGIVAQRNAALLLAVGPPLAIRGWNDWLDRHPCPRAWRRAAALALLASLLALAFDAGSGRFSLRIGDQREPGLSPMDPLYPIGAAEWIARERPPGPIFHHQVDGAYLIWRLHPDYPVLVDGRLEVFGRDALIELTGSSPQQFRRMDQRYRFGLVLLAHGLFDYQALMRELHGDPAWRLVFADETSVLFARVPAVGGAPWPAIDPGADLLFPPLPERRSVEDALRRVGRVRFYQVLGPPQRAAASRLDLGLRYPWLVGGG